MSPALTRAPGRLPLLHSDMKTLRDVIVEGEARGFRLHHHAPISLRL
jgi:hypothetical protein